MGKAAWLNSAFDIARRRASKGRRESDPLAFDINLCVLAVVGAGCRGNAPAAAPEARELATPPHLMRGPWIDITCGEPQSRYQKGCGPEP